MNKWIALPAAAWLCLMVVAAHGQAGGPVSIRTGQLNFVGLGNAAGAAALPVGERGFEPVSVRTAAMSFTGVGAPPGSAAERAFVPVDTRTGSLSFTGTRALP